MKGNGKLHTARDPLPDHVEDLQESDLARHQSEVPEFCMKNYVL